MNETRPRRMTLEDKLAGLGISDTDLDFYFELFAQNPQRYMIKMNDGNWQVVERNCADLTVDLLKSDLDPFKPRSIIYYDEFDRVTIPVQDKLLKVLEGHPYRLDALFIFSTAKPEKIDEALKQRVLHLRLSIPTIEEIKAYLVEKCQAEHVLIEDPSTLYLIAEHCECIPRKCLNFLWEHFILGEKPISNQSVEETIGRVITKRELITTDTIF